ncbi:hypothetical protein GCM10023213_34520 [Prosthecobacter algae]|uniref:Uncharacterized protein n=1 Tax=Prosthecobacter algae TaxID=1144682 RepID=A0ABP9PCK1_9BACT
MLLLSSSPLAAADEPPLPTWDGQAWESPVLTPGSQFSDLLPENTASDSVDGFFLEGSGPLKSPRLMVDDSGLSSHDLSLFLRGGLLNTPQEPTLHRPTPSLALRDVPTSVLESLRQVPVNEYLINPQSLVTEMPMLDLERLLQFHSTECRIRLYILVLDRDQKLASTALLNPLISRLRNQREICLAIYPLGEPWRARFMVSPLISQTSSLASMTEMAEDCIQDAMQVNDAEQQLQRFAVRLSTRLFWLEKSLPPANSTVHATVAGLTEVVTSPPGAVKASGDATHGGSFLMTVVTSLLSLAAAVGIYGGIRYWLRLRVARGKQRVWMLPETEVAPRLGGAFSGGAGAMIQYGSKTRTSGQ